MLRVLVSFTALFLLLACSNVGVHGSADLMFFRWPSNAAIEKDLAAAQLSLTGTPWLAEDIDGLGVIDEAQPTITFDREDGVAGSGGCNRYFGPVAIEGRAIRFGDFAATKMACEPALMDQEQKFFNALAATRSYRFDDPGKKLVFFGEDGTMLVRFSLLAP